MTDCSGCHDRNLQMSWRKLSTWLRLPFILTLNRPSLAYHNYTPFVWNILSHPITTYIPFGQYPCRTFYISVDRPIHMTYSYMNSRQCRQCWEKGHKSHCYWYTRLRLMTISRHLGTSHCMVPKRKNNNSNRKTSGWTEISRLVYYLNNFFDNCTTGIYCSFYEFTNGV